MDRVITLGPSQLEVRSSVGGTTASRLQLFTQRPVSCRKSGRTPLELAVVLNRLEIVKHFVEVFGARANSAELFWAALNHGRAEAAAYFLSRLPRGTLAVEDSLWEQVCAAWLQSRSDNAIRAARELAGRCLDRDGQRKLTTAILRKTTGFGCTRDEYRMLFDDDIVPPDCVCVAQIDAALQAYGKLLDTESRKLLLSHYLALSGPCSISVKTQALRLLVAHSPPMTFDGLAFSATAAFLDATHAPSDMATMEASWELEGPKRMSEHVHDRLMILHAAGVVVSQFGQSFVRRVRLPRVVRATVNAWIRLSRDVSSSVWSSRNLGSPRHLMASTVVYRARVASLCLLRLGLPLVVRTNILSQCRVSAYVRIGRGVDAEEQILDELSGAREWDDLPAEEDTAVGAAVGDWVETDPAEAWYSAELDVDTQAEWDMF